LRLEEGRALQQIGYAYLNKGNYPPSLQTLLSAMAILDDPKTERNALVGKFSGDDDIMYRKALPHLQRLSAIALTESSLGILYSNQNNYEKPCIIIYSGRQKGEESGNVPVQTNVNLTLGLVYLNLKKIDSALISLQRSYALVMQSGYKRYLGSILLNIGRIYAARRDTALANDYYRRSLVASAEQDYFRGIAAAIFYWRIITPGLARKIPLFCISKMDCQQHYMKMRPICCCARILL
jgi:tetratricopeptide (TPR) repeat protein